jgi:hypothetical protein
MDPSYMDSTVHWLADPSHFRAFMLASTVAIAGIIGYAVKQQFRMLDKTRDELDQSEQAYQSNMSSHDLLALHERVLPLRNVFLSRDRRTRANILYNSIIDQASPTIKREIGAALQDPKTNIGLDTTIEHLSPLYQQLLKQRTDFQSRRSA